MPLANIKNTHSSTMQLAFTDSTRDIKTLSQLNFGPDCIPKKIEKMLKAQKKKKLKTIINKVVDNQTLKKGSSRSKSKSKKTPPVVAQSMYDSLIG